MRIYFHIEPLKNRRARSWSFSFALTFLFVCSTFAFETVGLSITNGGLGSSNVLLSWPGSPADWVLERSIQSVTGVWSTVPAGLVQSNANVYLSAPADEGGSFYRLRWSGGGVSGLTADWGFDNGTGPFFSAGGGAAPQLFTTNTSAASGRVGATALQFNGGGFNSGGSRVWVSNLNNSVLPAGGQPFSVSFWFSLDDWSTGWRGLAGNDPGGTNGWHLAEYTPGLGTNYLVFTAEGAPGSLSITGQTLLLSGQWHQLTATYDGTTGSVYLDSVLMAQGQGVIPAQTGPVYFGGGVAGYASFLGRIDDIRTYTSCLTLEDISLTGNWHFDENGGNILTDSSIQGHHLLMNNPSAWTAGHAGSAITLSNNPVTVLNNQFLLLPGSGGAFSVSFWLKPVALTAGESALMSCGDSATGWQLSLNGQGPDQSVLHMCSTNCGGSLDVSALVPLTNGVWTKLEVTYNGGVATLYANGRQLQNGSGAIRGTSAALHLAWAPGLPGFNGVMDELKIYNRERHASEIGPVALASWETVFLNATTNLVLQGTVPPGRTATFTLLSSPVLTNGSLSQSTAGSPVVTYHAGSRKGPDAFAFTVTDGEFTSAPVVFPISVVAPHWLSPTGGSTLPLDGSSPVHAWAAGTTNALDDIWHTNTYFDCFIYAPGVYLTHGWKYLERSTVNPGCKHYGSGTNQTILRLVDIWEPATEETIFATAQGYIGCDNFEVSGMTLDCNATNMPKYVYGKPVTIRIPLATNGLVTSVALHWNISFGGNNWQFGPASQYKVSALQSGTVVYTTNVTDTDASVMFDTVPVGVQADEVDLELDRRASGVEFYSLNNVQINGPAPCLPTATVPGGGESKLSPTNVIILAIDNTLSTSWASGSETQAQIMLPCNPAIPLTQLNIRWNCQTVTNLGRLGPATGMLLRARDTNTGQLFDVPFVRHGQDSSGWDPVSFGTSPNSNPVMTDQLVILFTNRDPQVDFYSVREFTVQNGGQPIPLRVPSADSELSSGNGMLRAFDEEPGSWWVCNLQGMVGGINMHGSNTKLTHLKIIGFGTTAGRECFPLAFVSSAEEGAPVHTQNVLIEDCAISDPAPANDDGVTCVSMIAHAPDTLANAVVRGCSVTDLRGHFTYTQAYCSVRLEQCYALNCQRGAYFEPDNNGISHAGSVLIRSNRFVNVDWGVNLFIHTSAAFDDLTIEDNEFILNPGNNGAGFSDCDGCTGGSSGTISNVTALNNIIRYPDWSPRPGYSEWGLLYSDIQSAVFGNNVIALGTPDSLRVRQCPTGFPLPVQPTDDCAPVYVAPAAPFIPFACMDNPPAGYQRAWYNNRDLSGTLLNIRVSKNGVNQPATQQQWPQ